MGGGRLPREETLKSAAFVIAAVTLVVAGCRGGGAAADATPSPPVSASPGPAQATPTATPDPLAGLPSSQAGAHAWLQLAIAGAGGSVCPPRLQELGVSCVAGDVDGDQVGDLAFLVPVKIAGSQVPHPSAVFLRRGAAPALEEFSLDLTADSSLIGRSAFALADRTGDRRGDLTYIENRCGASGCRTVAVIETWDGSAWRDAGAADPGINNVDSVVWEGTGAASVLRIHGAKLPATAPPEAGPSRASTTTYELVGARYAVTGVQSDPPEYLYHAFLDADEIFQADKEAGIAAFEALLEQMDLKDWQSRPGQPDRRPSLQGFALFRIALATAVLQKDPATLTAAIDRVILESRKPAFEPLFVNVAMEFRRGFNENGGVIGGCAAVNLYLSRPVEGANTRAYVEQLFNYGYANPPGSRWLTEICPF